MPGLPLPPPKIASALLKGMVIPAHPLALDNRRQLDERRQCALSRYYLAAGAGGLAVGVHTTQFEIRDAQVGLYKPVLELGMDVARAHQPRPDRPVVMVAGICGQTTQAMAEAETARDCGYVAGLLSLAALPDANDDVLIDHCRQVSSCIPIFGFYLQPAVGGRVLDYRFWRRFVEIENVVAVKIAPFNRYQTIDVIRAVADSGRAAEIALYTGNDDTIVQDLLTTYEFDVGGQPTRLRITGGLLGHWAVWTRSAVSMLDEIHQIGDGPVPSRLITIANQVTDANAAFFDAANGFRGCIAGINEVLRRQGMLQGRWCLDEKADLSPGQAAEIDRVYAAYPHLNDDVFVETHLEQWLD